MKRATAIKPAAKSASLSTIGVWGAIALVCVLAVFAHARLSAGPGDYTGPLASLDRVFDLFLVATLGTAAFATGRTLSRLVRIPFDGAAEELSLSTLAGTGVLGLLLLGIGLIGLLNPAMVLAVFGIVFAVTWREVRNLPRLIREGLRSVTSTRAGAISAVLFTFLVVLLIWRTATPPHSADEVIYHLPVSKLFVDQGGVVPVYDNFSGNMPFLVNMIYVLCLMAKADIAARLFSLLIAVITGLSVYAFGTRFFSQSVGRLGLFGFFGAGMVIEVAVTARNDVSLAGFLFGTTYALMVFLKDGQKGWLYLASVLAGFSLGVKYSAVIWVLALGLMLLVEGLVIRRTPVLAVLKNAFIFGAITLAVASPWFIKNYVWFKNPVYPYGTGEVANYGSKGVRYFTIEDQLRLNKHFEVARSRLPEVAKAVDEELARWASIRFERNPFRFWEFFIEPHRYNMSVAESYQDPNYLFLAAPLFVVFSRSRWLVWLALLSVMFFVMVAWTSWIARYFLPVYPALTVLAVYSLDGVAQRFKASARTVALLPALVVGIATVSTVLVSSVQAYNSGALSFQTGAISRHDFMSATFYYPVLNFANKNLPPGSRILMIGAQLSYELRHGYVAEAGWDSIEWQRVLIRNTSMAEVNEDLKKQGITHIIFNPGLYKFIAEMGREGSGPSGTQMIPLGDLGDGVTEKSPSTAASGSVRDYESQLRNWVTFELYRTGHLEPVFVYEDYYVYKIK